MFFRFFILLSILTAPAFAFAADFVVTLHTPVNEIRQKISSAILEEPDFNLWAINQDSSTENIVVVMSEKSFASIAIYPTDSPGQNSVYAFFIFGDNTEYQDLVFELEKLLAYFGVFGI